MQFTLDFKVSCYTKYKMIIILRVGPRGRVGDEAAPYQTTKTTWHNGASPAPHRVMGRGELASHQQSDAIFYL